MLFGITTTILTFYDIKCKEWIFWIILIVSAIWLLFKLYKAANLENIKLEINNTKIDIRKGDIFNYSEDTYKVIAFNEFFDTQVDDKVISRQSLNGQFLEKYNVNISEFDIGITQNIKMNEHILETDVIRPLGGKTTKYKLGAVFDYNDYLLLAFSKFDMNNKANLNLSDYIVGLLYFWEEIDRLYAQKQIVIPLLGTGITRQNNFNATNQELLEMILWTFKQSKVSLKSPSKLVIVLHEDQHKTINFYNLKEYDNNGI